MELNLPKVILSHDSQNLSNISLHSYHKETLRISRTSENENHIKKQLEHGIYFNISLISLTVTFNPEIKSIYLEDVYVYRGSNSIMHVKLSNDNRIKLQKALNSSNLDIFIKNYANVVDNNCFSKTNITTDKFVSGTNNIAIGFSSYSVSSSNISAGQDNVAIGYPSFSKSQPNMAETYSISINK